MNDVNYISVEDIKEISSISQNVDPQFLVPYIRSSEGMFIIPVIGTALNTELKNQLTANTVTVLNNTLIQYYIKPLSAWSTFLSSVPFLAFKSTNKGILRQGSDNSTIPTIQDINWFKQSIKDTKSFYEQEITKYLVDNADLYPNYRSSCNNNATDFSNGIWLG